MVENKGTLNYQSCKSLKFWFLTNHFISLIIPLTNRETKGKIFDVKLLKYYFSTGSVDPGYQIGRFVESQQEKRTGGETWNPGS